VVMKMVPCEKGKKKGKVGNGWGVRVIDRDI
jgi:hypothetical protein